MKPLERLGEAKTPNGTVIALFRHDGDYLIKADRVELMSSRRHFSEDRLAEVACRPIRDRTGARVLVGGLGLGFTMRAALQELRADGEVVVAELLSEVIAWNANPEYNISADAMRDPRVTILNDDIVNVLRANESGFDAIMLDTDNGPDGMLISENARLYALRGVVATISALRQGGVVAYWSVADDPKFVDLLRRTGLYVETVHARAHETSGPMHTIYVCTRSHTRSSGSFDSDDSDNEEPRRKKAGGGQRKWHRKPKQR